MKVCICCIPIVSRSRSLRPFLSEGDSFVASSSKFLSTLISKLLLTLSSLKSFYKLSARLSLIDSITQHDLWCTFKLWRPLCCSPQEQLIYSTFAYYWSVVNYLWFYNIIWTHVVISNSAVTRALMWSRFMSSLMSIYTSEIFTTKLTYCKHQEKYNNPFKNHIFTFLNNLIQKYNVCYMVNGNNFGYCTIYQKGPLRTRVTTHHLVRIPLYYCWSFLFVFNNW